LISFRFLNLWGARPHIRPHMKRPSIISASDFEDAHQTRAPRVNWDSVR
jgi:hypothetical protein